MKATFLLKPTRASRLLGSSVWGRVFAVLLIAFLQNIVLPNVAYAQITVKGQILDETNAGLPGASIVVKGTTNGAITDVNGNFSLQTTSGATLVVSYIGYETEEVSVKDNTPLSISLKSGKALSEVIVVGYGTQKKVDVTGAVSSVNLEALRNAPNTNIAQYLQGTVPGLNVGVSTSAGGTPPISIRGRVTLNGSQSVLIILDGIQYTGSLSSINPDDIASIDVLKDASSTAVYGAQAANGVILITSRKGKFNQKPSISFSSAYTSQHPTVGQGLTPFDRDGYIKQLTEGNWDKAYLAPTFTQPNPAFKVQDVADATMRDGAGNLLANNYDWFGEGTNNGSILENNLSISGGSDKVSYLLSGSTVNQKGFIVNDHFKRQSIRANLEVQPLDWMKVGLVSSLSLVNQDGQEPSFNSILRVSPLLVPYDANGNLIPFPTNTIEPSPFMTYLVDDYDRNKYLFANIYTEIDVPFIKGLKYRLNFGNNYRLSQRFNSSIFGAGQTGSAYKNTQDYYDYTLDNIVTYNRNFGKHEITGTFLYGAVERKFNSVNSRAEGFTRLTLGYNNLSLGNNKFAESDAWNEALNYQMARINYKFGDRYLLTATARRDGFSGFAKNNKSAIFPVAALGWIVSEESFMKNIKAIDFLKLRVGYGSIGNQTSRYSSIARVSTNAAYVFGDGGGTAFGQQVTTLGNDDLKWERTTGTNLGLDFTLFNSKLNGSLEYYNNNTTDLLYSVAIPAVTGFGSINTNLGKINNTGFEASVTYRLMDKSSFRWSSTLNFSTNQNKIITLTGVDADKDGKEDDLISSNLFIGRPISTVYNYQIDGINQLTDTRLPSFPVGSVKIIDQNGDNDITPLKDRIFLGREDPAYRASLSNTFEYKGFTLSVLINSIQGGKDGYLANNNPSYFREDNSIRNNILQGINLWSPSNPTGTYPRNISGSRAKIEPNMYQSRSFIRLQDVSLSYNLGNLFNSTKAKSFNLYMSGKNLKTWTNWEGWDPEATDRDSTTGVLLNGLNTAGRPVMRAFTFGLNIVY